VTPTLVVVSDFTRANALARVRKVALAARPGSVLLQLRDHDLATRERYRLGLELKAIAADSGQALAVNDRVDLLLALELKALHLGERSIATAEARRLAPDVWISRSCHRTSDLGALEADAVLLSPVMQARHDRAALGLDAIREARKLVGPKRLFAFGGITADTARACVDIGADGIAVMGAVLDSEDATPLLEALDIRR
jgi:thiamine-phosphate pyrophosphorylase